MKKLTYLISLISLILFISCGSIFAQAPTQYVTENGSIASTSSYTLNDLSAASANNTLVKPGWYYVDKSLNNAIYLANQSGGVNIIYSGDINITTTNYICVPSNASINFYQAAENNVAIPGTFKYASSCAYNTIGNVSDGSYGGSLDSLIGNFGNITFSSGVYNISNTSTSNIPAIGSYDGSGGTIAINQAAQVFASSGDSGKQQIAVGVKESTDKCTISINGGSLKLQGSTGYDNASAGTGNITLSNGGYFGTDGSNLPTSNFTQSGGLLNTYDTTDSCWNLNVIGTCSLPLKNGFNGVTLSGGGTITINNKADLTLGTINSDNQVASASIWSSSDEPSVVNNGNVLVNGISYPSTAKNFSTWDNNAGSSVTISETSNFNNSGNTLAVTNFNNKAGAELSILEGAVIQVGTINNSKGASGVNPGNIIVNGFISSGYAVALNNEGTVTVGPIGWAGYAVGTGEIVNNGSITSANPNYYGGTVYSMDIDTNGMTFYTNLNSDNDTVGDSYVQYQDLNFQAFGLAGQVLPSFFDYTIAGMNSNDSSEYDQGLVTLSSTIDGKGNLNWQEINENTTVGTLFGNSDNTAIPAAYQDGYYLNNGGNNTWALIMTPPTGNQTNWNLILASNGNIAPNIYQISAYPPDQNIDSPSYPFYLINGQGTATDTTTSTVFDNQAVTNSDPDISVTYPRASASDNARFSVATKNVTGVQITYQNQDINQYTINLDEASTVQFGYVALNSNDKPVTGTTAQWSIALSNGQPASKYATVNENGLVRVFGPLPTGVGLILTCTVQGQEDYLPILVTGTTPPDSSIEPVNNPLYLTADMPLYNLNNNIKFMPNGTPATQNGMPNITYTLAEGSTGAQIDSSDVIIPYNSDNTSTYTVTATTTLDGQQVSTTFDVKFTGQTEYTPTGITAAQALTFNNVDSASQNVNASFTPETTSMNILGDWYFDYNTSNPAVAIVDANGNVTPTGTGTATITTTTTVLVNSVQQKFSATTQVTVNDQPSDVPATSITADPAGPIYLAPSSVAEADHSQNITVTMQPETTTDTVTASIVPETVATLDDNGDGTYTVNAVADGHAEITFRANDNISTTVDVVVSSSPVVTSGITASGTTPDEFSVTVNNVQANPAIHTTGTVNIDNVSIFTWSGLDRNDMQCKPVPTSQAVNGNYTYTPFQVNGNTVNNWYFNADNINVECYAYISGGSPVYLGALTPDYSWMDATNTAGHNVAYITYQENNGFNRPTVFDGSVSGEVGQHLQLEGLRVSSCIDGVEVVTDVHEQNIGWVQGVGDGSYAGTQHEFRQIEAIRLRLTGDNASNYDIYYQVHAEDLGWTGPVSNEQVAGTTGENRQIEAVQIQIVPKGTSPSGWATN